MRKIGARKPWVGMRGRLHGGVRRKIHRKPQLTALEAGRFEALITSNKLAKRVWTNLEGGNRELGVENTKRKHKKATTN